MLQQQQGQAAPLSPTGQEASVQQVEKNEVEIVYGSNAKKFELKRGTTLGEVLAETHIKEAIGYGNVRDNLQKFVVDKNDDFKEVSDDYVLTGDEASIELIRPAGEKAR